MVGFGVDASPTTTFTIDVRPTPSVAVTVRTSLSTGRGLSGVQVKAPVDEAVVSQILVPAAFFTVTGRPAAVVPTTDCPLTPSR